MYLQLGSKNQTARDEKTIFFPSKSKENMVNEKSPTLNHAFSLNCSRKVQRRVLNEEGTHPVFKIY